MLVLGLQEEEEEEEDGEPLQPTEYRHSLLWAGECVLRGLRPSGSGLLRVLWIISTAARSALPRPVDTGVHLGSTAVGSNVTKYKESVPGVGGGGGSLC